MATSHWQVVVCALSILLPGTRASAQPAAGTSPASARASGGDLRLTFLGNAGWEITDGRVGVLVDPYLSRQWLDSIALARGLSRLTPAALLDEPLPPPDSVTIDARVRRADYILVTHGHTDHAFDAPYIARKRGAVVIGSETVANIARAYGVPDSGVITVVGGEDYAFEAFSLKVIPNLHTASAAPCCNKRFFNGPQAGATPRGVTAPLRVRDFQEGGNKAYLLRLAGHEVLIMGSMNYIEREMEGLRPDVALVGARNSRRQIYDYTARLLRALGHPALVLPTHCRQTVADEEARSFEAEVKASSPGTRVLIPRLFEPITVPSAR